MEIESEYFLGGLILFTIILKIILEKVSPKPKEKIRTAVVREIVTRIVPNTRYQPQLCPGCRKLLR